MSRHQALLRGVAHFVYWRPACSSPRESIHAGVRIGRTWLAARRSNQALQALKKQRQGRRAKKRTKSTPSPSTLPTSYAPSKTPPSPATPSAPHLNSPRSARPAGAESRGPRRCRCARRSSCRAFPSPVRRLDGRVHAQRCRNSSKTSPFRCSLQWATAAGQLNRAEMTGKSGDEGSDGVNRDDRLGLDMYAQGVDAIVPVGRRNEARTDFLPLTPPRPVRKT